MSKRWEPIRLRGVGGMPQYEAGSDGKCFNIRQGVRRRTTFGVPLLLQTLEKHNIMGNETKPIFEGHDFGLKVKAKD